MAVTSSRPGSSPADRQNRTPGTPARRGWSWWYLLFVIQCVAVLWPPFFNYAEPYAFGLPFFYWYQLLWVILGAVLTAIVYFAAPE